MEELLTQIEKFLELKGLSDRQFSLRLGIDPSQFSRIRRGMLQPSMKFLNALVREFPELKLVVFEYIGSNGHKEITVNHDNS